MPSILIDPKRIFVTQSKVRLRRYASAAVLVLCCGLTFAQNVDSPKAPTGTATPSPVRQPSTPTPQTTEQPRRTGGGGSFGINIDIGSVINLLREVTKKDNKCEPEVEQGARSQFKHAPSTGMSIEEFVQKACATHKATILRRDTEIKTHNSNRSRQQSALPVKDTQLNASCKTNGNFETGGFIAWTGANNGPNNPPRTKANLPLITTVGISSGAINLDTSHQTIVTPGNDPILGALLPQVRPSGGGNAVRIGNTWEEISYFAGFGAEQLSKKFLVTAADAIVGFSYAVVMADGGDSHKSGGSAINPRFMVRVLNSTGTDITNNIAGGRVRLDSGPTPNILESDIKNPFFKSLTLPTYTTSAATQVTPVIAYKDWSCSEINLADMVGQEVTVEFITQDCDANGHFAYAYIDDFCSTCGPGPEGSIKLAESDKCGVGKVCVDVTVPKTGTTTGQATATLDIWQNGTKLTTYSSPAISADGKVCFPINPSSIPGLDMSKGFDYSAQASMTINGASGPYSLPTKLLGAGPDGLQPGSNNDYTPTCGNVTNTPLCITCLCGHPGQPVCPACGQAGQPLCAQSCLAADYVQPVSLPKPDISPKTRNAVSKAAAKGTK